MLDCVHEEDATTAVLCPLRRPGLTLRYGHRNGVYRSHVLRAELHKPVKKSTRWCLRPACQGCKSLPLGLGVPFSALTALIKHVNPFE